MDGLSRINDFSDPKPSETAAQMSSSTSTSGTGILGDTGDDRDRTIAKAALSIAELGE